ncbi:hypothetical protein PR202_gb21480 [Eleusine coracana subsp. coracana]|uniref:C2H2-type domain-containing protein n=1 Tax=Eleusine coracana subsp. coracana TaxID=191504 RepID=A0AAV5FEV0_ELECO|nr:hypothetical protein QOZ80_7BG0606490 [Eleusine coracana subsp. coracana]GJN32935.1 hypothetical protein PR202_gb21480 [Eleusine coracana subsp. coracana]
MALDVSSISKPPVPPPSPPRVDSWARGGRRSKRRAGSADAAAHQQSEEEHLALCLLMLSRGVRGEADEDNAGAVNKTATTAAAKGYECSVCGKVYASYQALGGHKTSHRKPPAPTPPTQTQPQPPVPAAEEAPHAAEEKVHQCSLCLRTFPSGQALGGHKRLHYEGGASVDGVNKEQHVIKAAKPGAAAAVLRDFDLNLPAAAATTTTAVAAMEDGEIAPPEAKRARVMLVAV